MLYWRNYAIVCIAESEIKLPEFGANLIRGKFGATFRKLVCLRKASDCSTCMLRFSCPYFYVFETRPPPGTRIMRKYNSAPRPFVISLPFKEIRLKKGDSLRIDLTLIGKANDYLPHFAYTFLKVLKKMNFRLQSIFHEGNDLFKGEEIEIPVSSPKMLSFEIMEGRSFFSVSLSFETPLRLIFNERFQEEPSFSALLRNFFRRIVLLDYFHCGGDGIYPFKGILEELENVMLKEGRFVKKSYRRFSHRRSKPMRLEGILGEAVYAPVPSFLLSYLDAMKDLHVGRNTTFGFGKVVMKDARGIKGDS
ncbi:MAG: CRISPR system precrRNA processing endoribonuclease RAMP protein Cas6 [Synergistetes bacterium]|nr:CRISPR system precrRNA processing endoribonuclease RAMP protein Cas6 [Synergistota bacterium]